MFAMFRTHQRQVFAKAPKPQMARLKTMRG